MNEQEQRQLSLSILERGVPTAIEVITDLLAVLATYLGVTPRTLIQTTFLDTAPTDEEWKRDLEEALKVVGR